MTSLRDTEILRRKWLVVLIVTAMWLWFGRGAKRLVGFDWRENEGKASAGKEAGDNGNVCHQRLVGGQMCPELFLLGVGKGGSTSLFTFLMEQKLNISVAQNLMPGFRVKEPHYFDLFFAEPLETYASYYPVRRDETSVAIDATPVFTDIHALERIKQRLPSRNLRFIVSFRDPVSRGFSWYLHTVNQFLDRPNFGHMLRSFNTSFSLIAEYTSKEILQCLHRENSIANQAHCVHISNWNPGPRPPTSYIQPANLSEKQLQLAFAYLTAGLYGPILHRWLQYYDPSQFCVLFFEKIVENFAENAVLMQPCLSSFGRTLNIPADLKLPYENVRAKSCTNCESFNDESYLALGRSLHRELYRESNQQFRDLYTKRFGRNDYVIWEAAYCI